MLALNESPEILPDDELICLGHGEDLAGQGGALAPPIVQTSLFAQVSLEQLHAGLSAEHRSHVYTRGQNPTVEAVEEKIARLEGGDRCKCVASGMAAISAVLLGSLQSGDHVLFANQIYGPTLQLATRLARFGVAFDQSVEGTPEALERLRRPETRLLWLESPGTMLFRELDLEALAGWAKEAGLLTVVDNSWATPLFQKPLALGIDLVVHSATKYLGGHSDLVAGAIVGGAEPMERLFYDAYLLQGGALGPFDAWLLNRGIRTLPARMRQHHQGALEVARRLATHRHVERVFHPGLAGRAERAASPLTGYSGLFSIELAVGGYEALCRFVNGLRRFRVGVSWGGAESLVLAPFRGDNTDALAQQEIPRGTVRLSIGLEPPEVLIADLESALEEL